jgi:hypothetical protein
MGKVVESELQLSDSFVDYLDDLYFPGALDTLTSEQISFEFDIYFNAYAKY